MSYREHVAIDVIGGIDAASFEAVNRELVNVKRVLRALADLADRFEVRATTATTVTMTDEDDVILVSTAAGAVVVNSPSPSLIGNRTFTIKKTTTDANTITFTPASGTVDGAATHVFGAGARESRTFYCDGVNFHVV